MINGKPSQRFQACKGIRQGDPMSPYLFSICMEYLSRSLNALKNSMWFGFHPKCRRVGVISLLFTDNLLVFAKADKVSLGLVKSKF